MKIITSFIMWLGGYRKVYILPNVGQTFSTCTGAIYKTTKVEGQMVTGRCLNPIIPGKNIVNTYNATQIDYYGKK